MPNCIQAKNTHTHKYICLTAALKNYIMGCYFPVEIHGQIRLPDSSITQKSNIAFPHIMPSQCLPYWAPSISTSLWLINGLPVWNKCILDLSNTGVAPVRREKKFSMITQLRFALTVTVKVLNINTTVLCCYIFKNDSILWVIVLQLALPNYITSATRYTAHYGSDSL